MSERRVFELLRANSRSPGFSWKIKIRIGVVWGDFLVWPVCRYASGIFWLNLGGFCRGFSWRVFPGTFSHKKWGGKIRQQNPRKNLSVAMPADSRFEKRIEIVFEILFEIGSAKLWKTAGEKLLGGWTGLKTSRGRVGEFFEFFVALFVSHFVLESNNFRGNFVLQRCHPRKKSAAENRNPREILLPKTGPKLWGLKTLLRNSCQWREARASLPSTNRDWLVRWRARLWWCCCRRLIGLLLLDARITKVKKVY